MSMATHRRESSEHAPSAHRRALAIIVLAGMLTIGFIGAALTDSYMIGLILSLLTGACIVIANLMIAPGSLTERMTTSGPARHGSPRRPGVFEIRHG